MAVFSNYTQRLARGRSRWRRRGIPLAAGAAVTAAVCLLHAAGLFEDLELAAYDIRVEKTADPSSAHPDIALVMIGQSSLDFFARESPDSGVWPWTRDYYVPVIEHCRAGGAKAILFDLIFTEASRNGDEALGQACRRLAPSPAEGPSPKAAGVFMAVPFLYDREASPPEIPERFAVPLGVSGNAAPPEYPSVRLPVETLLTVTRDGKPVLENGRPVDAVAAIGDVVLEKGGRHEPLLCRYRGRVYPSLAFAAWLDLRFPGYFALPPARRPILTLDADRRLHVPSDPPMTIPLDAGGLMPLNFRGPAGWRETGPDGRPRWRTTYPRHEIADVILSRNRALEGLTDLAVPPEAFKDKVVIVGADAAGLDTKYSPFGEWPGPLFHAAAMDTLLRGDFRVRWSRAAMVAVIAGLGLAVSLLAMSRSAWVGAAGAIGILFAYAAFSAHALDALRAWVDVVAPLTAGILAFGASAAANFFLEGRDKMFVSRAFQHFVPPAVVDRILEHPESLQLGGEKRELTIFFSDLAGFTSLSEVMRPEDLFSTLNEYLDHMTEVIHAHGGTLDKYVGDAIVAFWNAPESQPDHAVLACRAALANQKELQQFRDKLRMTQLPDFNARIGLNTGAVTVGFVGAKKRFQYTMIGDDANLASRLEGANKAYGTSILISETTFYAARQAVAAREVDLLRVKGKQRPVRVFELMGLAEEETDDGRKIVRLFNEGLAFYRDRKWAQARTQFEAVLVLVAGDGPALAYIERCDHYAAEPPPPDWDGVYTMKDK